MLEKFLIAIGLKQPQNIDINDTIPVTKQFDPLKRIDFQMKRELEMLKYIIQKMR